MIGAGFIPPEKARTLAGLPPAQSPPPKDLVITLEPGSTIEVEYQDGTVKRYSAPHTWAQRAGLASPALVLILLAVYATHAGAW